MPKPGDSKHLVRSAVKRERFTPAYATKEDVERLEEKISKIQDDIEQLKEELREQS